MTLLKKNEIKAEILNKLQSIITLLEQCEQDKKPSFRFLQITRRDLEKVIALIGDL